jgi:hypothetical protein
MHKSVLGHLENLLFCQPFKGLNLKEQLTKLLFLQPTKLTPILSSPFLLATHSEPWYKEKWSTLQKNRNWQKHWQEEPFRSFYECVDSMGSWPISLSIIVHLHRSIIFPGWRVLHLKRNIISSPANIKLRLNKVTHTLYLTEVQP